MARIKSSSRIHLSQIRNVQWATTYEWEVYFEDFPGLVGAGTNWFPAVDVEFPLATLQTTTFDLYNTSIQIPLKSASRSLRITFLDDSDFTLHQWLEEWMVGENGILNNGDSISAISNSVRQVIVRKIKKGGGHTETPVLTKTFQVFPEGELAFVGNTDNSATTDTINFVIVDEYGRSL